MSFNTSQQEKLEKSGYRFVGTHGHAAVKTCHWTRQSIVEERLNLHSDRMGR